MPPNVSLVFTALIFEYYCKQLTPVAFAITSQYVLFKASAIISSLQYFMPYYYDQLIGGDEDDNMMKEWFDLVCHKNKLLRQESDLVYM